MKIHGKVWKFGDHIDTDQIIPARFLNKADSANLAQNCFADYRPDLIAQVQPGDILLAGRNFGCGSSREQAPQVIKDIGMGVIIAKSFARIFYRNAFNIALPILESEAAVDAIQEGDTIAVDFGKGEIFDQTQNETFYALPVPEFMREIIQAGGLVAHIKSKNK